MAFLYCITAFCVVLIVCDLTQRSSDYFIDIYDTMLQWNWYLFQHDVQRLLPLILIVVQQPVELECFGGIACNRELAKRVSAFYAYRITQYVNFANHFIKSSNNFQVVNKGYSLFTMLRRFYRWKVTKFWRSINILLKTKLFFKQIYFEKNQTLYPFLLFNKLR